MEPTEKHLYWHTLSATFHDLPGWQKVIVVLSCLFLSPAILIVAVCVGLSLLPIVMLGQYEGTHGTMTDEIADGIRHRHERVEHYYAR